MKSILNSIILIIALASVASAEKHDCPVDSSQWCKSFKVASRCNVVDQCAKYIWFNEKAKQPADSDNDLVSVTLYYESLCPDCRQFMTGQFWKAYQAVANISNLTVIPYGNAKETWRNETKLWQFTCQHGSSECWGNLLHSCLIYFYPKTDDHLPYIHCMEANDQDDIKTASIKCAKQFPNISYNQLTTCMNSRQGNDLQHANAVKTEILSPAHTYVPWVTLNGVHTEAIEQQAETDLVGLICVTYKGSNPPPACQQKKVDRKCPRY